MTGGGSLDGAVPGLAVQRDDPGRLAGPDGDRAGVVGVAVPVERDLRGAREVDRGRCAEVVRREIHGVRPRAPVLAADAGNGVARAARKSDGPGSAHGPGRVLSEGEVGGDLAGAERGPV